MVVRGGRLDSNLGVSGNLVVNRLGRVGAGVAAGCVVVCFGLVQLDGSLSIFGKESAFY